MDFPFLLPLALAVEVTAACTLSPKYRVVLILQACTENTNRSSVWDRLRETASWMSSLLARTLCFQTTALEYGLAGVHLAGVNREHETFARSFEIVC